MNKHFLFLLVVGFVLSQNTFAQTKQLTIDDAVIGQYTNLQVKYLDMVRWRGNTDNFTYVESRLNLAQEGAKSAQKQTILKGEDLNAALEKEKLEKLMGFPNYEWKNDNAIQFQNKDHFIRYNLKSKKIELKIKYDENAENITFCNDKNILAYTIDNNLFVADQAGVKQVTKDTEKGIVNGQTVHRNEFGIDGGIFWSPKGSLLAFYRMDEAMVTDYPLVDVTARVAELKNIKYPMAGMKSHEVTVGIYNIANGKTTFLKTGEQKEQYLTNVAWSPDEKYVFIAVLNRGQNLMKFSQYDAVTGEFVKTLFEEKNDRYVEPLIPMAFLPSNTNQFVWQSQRDGYNHLYLYDISGKLIKQITKGEWIVKEVIGFDKTVENIYFKATKETPIETHIYKVNIASAQITKLTLDAGVHNCRISGNGNYFIDFYSSSKVPKNYEMITTNGKLVRTILSAENPMKDYKLGEMRTFTIKAGDGKTDLYCRLIKPVDFDPNKKYPAVIYVYGGPHAQMTENAWLSGGLWNYYMAQKGYVMLTIDNRGSANRGFEFESIIHRNIGVAEMEDQMKGVDYLKGLGFVDMNRLGVHGWSYGGFITTSLMTKHNEAFKVGVAGGPVIDWKYYEVMYGERYMDTPDENPEGYKKASLLNSAKDLKGKLLIIQGYLDNTVVPQHGLMFVKECVKNKVQVDYFIYPKAEHNVVGYDRIHLMQKVTQYFDDYLK